MSGKLMVETLITSVPEIRHLLDIACPMHVKGDRKIESVIIICKSMFIRKYLLECIQKKCGFCEYKYFDVDMCINEGDVLAKITQAKDGEFLLCDSDNLNVNDTIKKLLVRIINDGHCDIQLGKGTAAKQIRMELAQATYVFSCEKDTPTTEVLKKHCKCIIQLDDKTLKKLCVSCVAALLNEINVDCSPTLIKAIAKENDNDIDKCYKSISMIRDYIEFNSLEDVELTRELLEKILGTITHNVNLEYLNEIRELRHVFDEMRELYEEYGDAESFFKHEGIGKVMRNIYYVLRDLEKKLS